MGSGTWSDKSSSVYCYTSDSKPKTYKGLESRSANLPSSYHTLDPAMKNQQTQKAVISP